MNTRIATIIHAYCNGYGIINRRFLLSEFHYQREKNYLHIFYYMQMHRHPPFNYDLKTYTYVGGFLFLCCEKHDKSFDPYDRRFRTKFRAAFDGKRLIINCDGRKKSYTINHQSNLNYILYRTSYNLMDYSN